MNTLKLTQKLFEMASDQSKYAKDIYTAIINVIIVQYLTRPRYMEENAIATFEGFLKNGILSW